MLHRLEHVVASDQPNDLCRKIMRLACRRIVSGRLLLVQNAYWRDEAIAAAWTVDDVLVGGFVLAQRAAQRGDLNREVRIDDMRIRPGELDELVLSDKLAGMLNECDQYLDGLAAQADDAVALEQRPLGGRQAKRPEKISTLGLAGVFRHPSGRHWLRKLLHYAGGRMVSIPRG